jgi:hypothetical protein
MKRRLQAVSDDMRAEYNFDYSKGVRGKYCKRFVEGPTNVVILDPDVAKAFPNRAAVHTALRSVMRARRARGKSR